MSTTNNDNNNETTERIDKLNARIEELCAKSFIAGTLAGFQALAEIIADNRKGVENGTEEELTRDDIASLILQQAEKIFEQEKLT